MRCAKLLICLVLFSGIVLLASCSGSVSVMTPPLLEPMMEPIDTAHVTRGVVEALDILPGITRLPTVAARLDAGSGYLGEIYAWPGDAVTEGQLLARLGAPDLDEMIEELEESLALTLALHELDLEEFSVNISLLELALNSASGNARDLRGQLELLRLDRRHAISRHELEVVGLEAALDDLRGKKEQTEIISPIAGEVVITSPLGTWVNTFDAVTYIAHPKGVFVEYVGPPVLWDVELVQGVINDKVYDLQQISYSLAERLEFQNQGIEQPVRFEVQTESLDLLSPGETVFIRRYTDRIEDALRIPGDALFRGGRDSDFVYRIKDGEQELLYVTVGVVTELYVQILDGLNEGDEVLVRP